MKKSMLTLMFPQGRTYDIEVTFTDAACLVVHETIHWYPDKEEPQIVPNDWTISQFPTGYKIFDGIASKRGAINCANKYLKSHLFVGMSVKEFYEDFRATKLTPEEVDDGIRALVDAREYIDRVRSGLEP